MLYLNGKVASIRKSSYEGKESVKLQFIDNTGNGISLIEVKLSENENSDQYKDNMSVVVPVSVSSVNGNIYYKQTGKIKVA